MSPKLAHQVAIARPHALELAFTPIVVWKGHEVDHASLTLAG
jgi:hypothetical protein